MTRFGFVGKAEATVVRPDNRKGIQIGGFFTIEHIRDGKVLQAFNAKNGVTNQGRNYILNVAFMSSPAKTSLWYIGLIDNNVTHNLADSDVYNNHAGWSEVVPYSGNRPQWQCITSNAQYLTNTTAASFTITSSASIYGIFLCDLNTTGGYQGTNYLFSTASFPSAISVVNGDTLKVTYTLNAV